MGQRTKATPASGPATSYGYDQAGNLTTINRPEEGVTPKIDDSYAYNGDGLRTSQTRDGTTSQLTWDTSQGLPVLLSDGTNRFVYGSAGPIEQVDTTTGAVTYLHHDQADSTRLLTDEHGQVTGGYTYGAYGETTGHTGTAKTPLGYDGQYTSSDTGLIYLRARVYDPSTAQFLTRDPAVAITRAPFNYAGDNPLNYGDRSGLGEGEIELPCVWPFCGPPTSAIEGVERIGKGINEFGEGVVEGAEISWRGLESVWNTSSEDCAPGQRSGDQLKRESDEIRGRGHNPARRKAWNEWYGKLTPKEKKSAREAGIPRPRRRD